MKQSKSALSLRTARALLAAVAVILLTAALSTAYAQSGDDEYYRGWQRDGDGRSAPGGFPGARGRLGEAMDKQRAIGVDQISAHGRIVDVNREKREFTLRDDSGRTLHMYASERLSDFDQIRPNDTVNVTYLDSVAVAVDTGTDTRKQLESLAGRALGVPSRAQGRPESSTRVLVSSNRAPGDAIAANVSTRLATVQQIDKQSRRITLEGSDGRSIRVDPSVQGLESINPGDRVTTSQTEMIALDVYPDRSDYRGGDFNR